MKTKAHVLITQVYEVEVNSDPNLIKGLYPNFGNAISYIDRDKLNHPEVFGTLLSEQKVLIDCYENPIEIEPQTSENVEVLEGELV